MYVYVVAILSLVEILLSFVSNSLTHITIPKYKKKKKKNLNQG